MTYSSYLKIKELLSLQKPLSKPPAHDEMLFIIIHQTYELWFKLLLFELKTVAEHLAAQQLQASLHLLGRSHEIFKVLIQQIDILETMTPTDFNLFRSNLNPASGFQSVQFRELELLLGAKQTDYKSLFEFEPEWKQTLTLRMKEPSLRDALFTFFSAHKLLSGADSSELRAAILKIYYEPQYKELIPLCESLIVLDEKLLLWRFRHVQMVERMIGMKKGTGGSLGVSYLQTTLSKRYFGELWEARTEMNGGY